ncbi:16S rRNA (uracil(1498)-N(3))-methyltransferase [Hydrogenophaga sp. 5NK40-0174]|uniref:16S rRNA (uracil(1498)-N(3))-methyltransferase n=1 Tax=Hydrogenophaga sp. 5NK40-0174 TaxID=3127649 RepID=UPI003105B94F
MPRFFCPVPLSPGADLSLPKGAARHVQVLRMQPGQTLTVFNGQGGQWNASILSMGRSDVVVRIMDHEPVEREASRQVHLAMGMPANDRMDWLIEKATELGVASVQPLMTAHAVVKLDGARAEKKRSHWAAIAASACEQCGGNRVPDIHRPMTMGEWLATDLPAIERFVLSLAPGSQPLATVMPPPGQPLMFLSGPEGGLSPQEEQAAISHGFSPVGLGGRTLRAETAALAALVQAVACPAG